MRQIRTLGAAAPAGVMLTFATVAGAQAKQGASKPKDAATLKLGSGTRCVSRWCQDGRGARRPLEG